MAAPWLESPGQSPCCPAAAAAGGAAAAALLLPPPTAFAAVEAASPAGQRQERSVQTRDFWVPHSLRTRTHWSGTHLRNPNPLSRDCRPQARGALHSHTSAHARRHIRCTIETAGCAGAEMMGLDRGAVLASPAAHRAGRPRRLVLAAGLHCPKTLLPYDDAAASWLDRAGSLVEPAQPCAPHRLECSGDWGKCVTWVVSYWGSKEGGRRRAPGLLRAKKKETEGWRKEKGAPGRPCQYHGRPAAAAARCALPTRRRCR
jgi:hypothetical protein